MQALNLLALDPIAETTADRPSYGFRQGRNCADAIERCFSSFSRANPAWVLEGDIKGCFDNISHEWLLDHVPMDKSILRKCLLAPPGTGRVSNRGICEGLSRVSWKLSRTVLRGGDIGNSASPLDREVAVPYLKKQARMQFYITSKDGVPMTFAGLWERWRPTIYPPMAAFLIPKWKL
jgi:Reverse transcriptase (RNA-dependent DNA polymerase)